MEHVVLQSTPNLRPPQALDTLAGQMDMDRAYLVYHLPELEGYKNGNVEVRNLDDGTFHVVGDLAAPEEPAIYYSPVQMQFYNDQHDALRESIPLNNPRVVELPKRINVMLVREPQQEEPVYLVRDLHQSETAGLPQEQVPAGVLRAVIKRAPTEEEMMATYDDYQNRIQYAPDQRAHEQNLYLVMDRLGSHQPHYVAHAGNHHEHGHYLAAYPELHGYQPTHLRQMSHALQARNPLYLRNAPIAKYHQKMRTEDVLRMALWVAIGIFVGVLLGIYFT